MPVIAYFFGIYIRMGTSKNRHERTECKEPRSESPRHIK
jgi:hypothetical protein